MRNEVIGLTRRLRFAALFLSSILFFAPGIGSTSLFTDIDEYHRIYRTALTILETNEWLAPVLDGTVRVRKPPLVYWLTAINFKLFGVSLYTGRALNLLFSALLIWTTARIAYELMNDAEFALSAGMIAMSSMGLAITSKFLMHDAAVAAMSGLAFYGFLVWRRTSRASALLGTSAALAIAFLFKGPVAFVVAGSGIASVLLTSAATRAKLWDERLALLSAALLFVILGLGWFVYVLWLYPHAALIELQKEIHARHIGDISIGAVIALPIFALPWTFIGLGRLQHPDPEQNARLKNLRVQLVIFLVLTLAPFLFFRFIPRYILGSVIPFALLAALNLNAEFSILRLGRRLGAVFVSFIVLPWLIITIWLQTSSVAVTLTLICYGYFMSTWWRDSEMFPAVVSAALLWLSVVSILLPSFRSNAIPDRIVDRVRNGTVILYKNPEPAFLPIALKQSLIFTTALSPSLGDSLQTKTLWIFVKEKFQQDFERETENLGARAEIVDSYKAFPSMEGMASQFRDRKGFLTRWSEALRRKSLEPFQETFLLYRFAVRY